MNRFSEMGSALPPVMKNLLLANVTVFLFQAFTPLGPLIEKNFALSFVGVFEEGKIWQLFTYMFLHGGFGHIFWNMFALWMFGTEIEHEWGSREFFKYYILTGVGAGLLNIFLSEPHIATVGASGALYGIFAAYLVLWPNRIIYLNFLFPVKAKYLIGFLALVSLFSTINPGQSFIAHAAHLGGFVIGIVYLKFWKVYYTAKSFINKNLKGTGNTTSGMSYHKGGAEDNNVEYYRKKIDELLDKINRVGYLNLSDEEKKLLDEGSRYLREHDAKNIN